MKSVYKIDYNDYKADVYLHSLSRGAIEQGFDGICRDAERVLSYLRRFERDFEALQRALQDSVQGEHYRADTARKNQEDPSPYEMRTAELSERRSQNEYTLKDLRDAIRTVEDYIDAVKRAQFWGDQLANNARTKACNLKSFMEDYDAVRVGRPDVFHKQISPIRKLTDGGK